MATVTQFTIGSETRPVVDAESRTVAQNAADVASSAQTQAANAVSIANNAVAEAETAKQTLLDIQATIDETARNAEQAMTDAADAKTAAGEAKTAAEGIDTAIETHNTATDAHEDIRQLIADIDVSDQIATHNTATDAHADIRQSLATVSNNISTMINNHNSDSAAHPALRTRIAVLEKSGSFDPNSVTYANSNEENTSRGKLTTQNRAGHRMRFLWLGGNSSYDNPQQKQTQMPLRVTRGNDAGDSAYFWGGVSLRQLYIRDGAGITIYKNSLVFGGINEISTRLRSIPGRVLSLRAAGPASNHLEFKGERLCLEVNDRITIGTGGNRGFDLGSVTKTASLIMRRDHGEIALGYFNLCNDITSIGASTPLAGLWICYNSTYGVEVRLQSSNFKNSLMPKGYCLIVNAGGIGYYDPTSDSRKNLVGNIGTRRT